MKTCTNLDVKGIQIFNWKRSCPFLNQKSNEDHFNKKDWDKNDLEVFIETCQDLFIKKTKGVLRGLTEMPVVKNEKSM